MCASRKQIVTGRRRPKPVIDALVCNRLWPAKAGIGAIAALALTAGTAAAADATAGSLALGESRGGVTDRAYIAAPPNWSFVVVREPGSFLDCGEGMSPRLTDEDGRDLATLSCGVTLTETIAIPAAAESARIIVHF